MNTNYLKYQASSIQELLRRKLLESGILTDQLYPSSDTKIIIDLFAWTFDVLTYILNNNISDALFSDTYLYENINRFVKLLSYNPMGYRTSQCQFKIDINQSQINNIQRVSDTIYIPKYSYVNSGKTDSNGNDICYTFITSYILNAYSYIANSGQYNVKILTPKAWPVLYNGKYKKYIQTFVANGIQYDSFTLSLLDLTSQNKIYVDHNLFEVYTQIINTTTGQKEYIEWKKVDNLILNSNKQNDYIFEMRLNQNKQYVLKFGNGIYGKIPQYGSYIHIIYFESNGQQGVIDTKQIDSNMLEINVEGFSTSKQMFNMLFQTQQKFKQLYGDLFITNSIFSQKCSKLSFINLKQSSMPSTFESVQSIKQNAPAAYKRGQRLITATDFQSYIKQNYGSIIHDVFVANNNYYISSFYSWLNKYNRLDIGIRQFYYRYADTCDFNNVYIWLVSAGLGSISTGNLENIIRDCNKLKCATAQLIALNAVTTKFIPFVQHSKAQYAYKNNSYSIDEYLNRIKIYVYKKQTAIISNQKLKQLVNDKIINYFLKQNQHIGSIINLSDITAQLMELNYISAIKTVNIPENNKNQIEYANGLSFAAYTTQLVANADFTVFTTAYSLQKFQFPQLYTKNVLNMIQIIDNTYNITSTEL